MKIASLAFLILFFSSLLAAQSRNAALENYFRRSLPSCPDGKINIEAIDPNAGGPAGFLPYRLTQTSSDTRCGRASFGLVSRAGNGIVMGDVVAIDPGPKPLESRIADIVLRLLKKEATVKISKQPLPDQLRRVTMTYKTNEGMFDYSGFVDSSERFLIIGRRGALAVEPGETLLKEVGVENAATRGSAVARIRIVELSDFQCPTCKKAHEELEPILKKNLNRISYSRLDLPLFEHHDWSLRAALAARAIQKVHPAKYWDFVDYVFSNQEAIRKDNVDKFIKDFAEDHSLDWARIGPLYRSAEEKKKMIQQVARSYNSGVFATPTYIINGQVVFIGENAANVKATLQSLLKAK